MSWSATPTRFSNLSRDGDSTTVLGSLVQCLTTLSIKKFFLIPNINLPWRNLRPLSTQEENLAFYNGYQPACKPQSHLQELRKDTQMRERLGPGGWRTWLWGTRHPLLCLSHRISRERFFFSGRSGQPVSSAVFALQNNGLGSKVF